MPNARLCKNPRPSYIPTREWYYLVFLIDVNLELATDLVFKTL